MIVVMSGNLDGMKFGIADSSYQLVTVGLERLAREYGPKIWWEGLCRWRMKMLAHHFDTPIGFHGKIASNGLYSRCRGTSMMIDGAGETLLE